MFKNNRKEYLCFLKEFIGLLTSIVNASNHTKCESLSNEMQNTTYSY